MQELAGAEPGFQRAHYVCATQYDSVLVPVFSCDTQAGFRAVIFDKDNTLTKPFEMQVRKPVPHHDDVSTHDVSTHL
jgi:hypothetical protein